MRKRKTEKYFILFLGISLMVGIVAIESFTQRRAKQNKGGKIMKLQSNAFNHQDFIPVKYSCKGEDVNPALSWKNVPNATKSFALSVKDPDAPMGTFVHWLVYDIDKDKREIPENSIPGKQVQNNFRKENYGGPCPPSGIHRYFFRLYALDVETLGNIKTMEEFDEKVSAHTIEKAELMGKFEK